MNDTVLVPRDSRRTPITGTAETRVTRELPHDLILQASKRLRILAIIFALPSFLGATALIGCILGLIGGILGLYSHRTQTN